MVHVGLFGYSGDNEVWTENTKIMLDDMHKRKIDLADEIFVINKNGYIGENTRSEIEYAIATGKEISYLEDIKTCWDCVERNGEECGVCGCEVYPDSEICGYFEEY